MRNQRLFKIFTDLLRRAEKITRPLGGCVPLSDNLKSLGQLAAIAVPMAVSLVG
jgi:hypothetical protein